MIIRCAGPDYVPVHTDVHSVPLSTPDQPRSLYRVFTKYCVFSLSTATYIPRLHIASRDFQSSQNLMYVYSHSNDCTRTLAGQRTPCISSVRVSHNHFPTSLMIRIEITERNLEHLKLLSTARPKFLTRSADHFRQGL